MNVTYLASASPQRRQILEELGISFRVLPVGVEEVLFSSAEKTVRENAFRKANAALAVKTVGFGDVVIGADTIVRVGRRILGKPKTPEEAKDYLARLSGREVEAWSGVAVFQKGCGAGAISVEKAFARMRKLSGEEIDWYVSTQEPLTRAGAFGISHYGEVFVEKLEGSYSCFAGLPKRSLLASILGQPPEVAKIVLPVPPPPRSISEFSF